MIDLFPNFSIFFLTAQSVAKCGKKTDITFVVDRSGSINRDDYDQMRKFLVTVGEALQIGERNDKNEVIGQGAVVTFSEETAVRILLKDSGTKGSFANAVNDMPGPLVGGHTRTDKALELADTDVVQESAGYREREDDVAKILVVITDGEQTPDKGYVVVGEAIKPFFKRDMTTFAIGVGLKSDKQRQEIREMVEDEANAMYPESYTQLVNNVDNFIRRFCPGI
jgi:uncharacterized protein YegL